MRKTSIALVVCAGSLVLPGTINGDQLITLAVSPTVMQAPGFVSVRVTIESDEDNRLLEIVAQSDDYTRSSTIDLDGQHAPRLSVFDYRNLPPGFYEVSGRLIGTHGKRAEVRRTVNIMPTAGSWRR